MRVLGAPFWASTPSGSDFLSVTWYWPDSGTGIVSVPSGPDVARPICSPSRLTVTTTPSMGSPPLPAVNVVVMAGP